jgi:hypothetical protein
MTIAPTQGSATGTPMPRLQLVGTTPSAEVAAAPTRDALVAVPTRDGRIVIIDVPDALIGRQEPGAQPRRGSSGVDSGRRGAMIAAEQAKLERSVADIQARFSSLGIRQQEGNSPVTAVFRPEFPNAAYAPDGLREHGLPRDSIGVGVDPRSGRSFGDAKDVVAHELAHRIIDHMTGGKMSMHPMSEDVAVHESLADTFAALVDDKQPWVLGEDLVEPVRIMDQPERMGHPGHVDDLKSMLAPDSRHMNPIGRVRGSSKDVQAPDWHAVAGIPNKAAAMIGSELGTEKLGRIYINAVREHVRPGKAIEGLATAVLQSTKDLFGTDSREFRVTMDAWDAVGVLDVLKQQQRR